MDHDYVRIDQPPRRLHEASVVTANVYDHLRLTGRAERDRVPDDRRLVHSGVRGNCGSGGLGIRHSGGARHLGWRRCAAQLPLRWLHRTERPRNRQPERGLTIILGQRSGTVVSRGASS